MNNKFTILNGTATDKELAALEKALPTPVVKKVNTASRYCQIREALSLHPHHLHVSGYWNLAEYLLKSLLVAWMKKIQNLLRWLQERWL